MQSYSIVSSNNVQGGDDTFLDFPEYLCRLIGHALPKRVVRVLSITYPKFETRGDLTECVGRFREWFVTPSSFADYAPGSLNKLIIVPNNRLQNKVIDLEVAAATPSPTIEPSVHTVLIGHSMGGIVAAETLLAIASDIPIPASPSPHFDSTGSGPNGPPPSFIFPHITGILAFDTPYLGISPGVIAHGAETHYRTASSAWSTVSDVASVFGIGGAAGAAASAGGGKSPANDHPPRPSSKSAEKEPATLPSPATSPNADAAATPAWQRWGKYAMFAGAAGAVAAGGAAAYIKRDTLGEGWGWVSSHLEFVGCLAKGEELRSRIDRIRKLRDNGNIGFRNLVTVLGKGAGSSRTATAASTGKENTNTALMSLSKNDRTFCVLPPSSTSYSSSGRSSLPLFEGALNDRATSETAAHMEMFDRKQNPGYFSLANRARDLIVEWVEDPGEGIEGGAWYKTALSEFGPTADAMSDGEGSESSPAPDNGEWKEHDRKKEHNYNDHEEDGEGMVDIDLHSDGHPRSPAQTQTGASAGRLSPVSPHGHNEDEGGNAWAGEAPVFVEK